MPYIYLKPVGLPLPFVRFFKNPESGELYVRRGRDGELHHLTLANLLKALAGK